jgi:hypothetical protein
MAADPRIHGLMDHVEQMIQILEDIQKDMLELEKKENEDTDPDFHKIGFFKSQYKRARNAIDLLNDDLVTILIGLNNLSGPIKYMVDEE